jgi:hypothetical protein
MSAKTSISKLLRCPWNFEHDYKNATGDRPILFTYPFTEKALPPGVPDIFTALDPEAAAVSPPRGISPLLAKFCPVPIGATAAIYYPVVRAIPPGGMFTPGAGENVGWGYVWRVVFRLRSVIDYTRRKLDRIPFSIGESARGQNDTRPQKIPGRPNLTLAGERSVRPSSMTGLIFNPAPPDPNSPLPIFGYLYPDAVAIPAGNDFTECPIYPGSAGLDKADWATILDYEQGITDPELTTGGIRTTKRSASSNISKFHKIMGNEIAIECFKYNFETGGIPLSPRDWDFEIDENGVVVGGEDFGFSLLLGSASRFYGREPTADTGVRMIVGQWPE